MLQKLKKKIVNYLLRKLTLQVSAEDVFTYKVENRILYLFLNGKKLSEKEIRELQNEISAIEKFRIWSIYQNTLKDQAKQRMFEKSTTFDDIWSGKMMLKNLEVMDDINKLIKTWKPLEPVKPAITVRKPIEH